MTKMRRIWHLVFAGVSASALLLSGCGTITTTGTPSTHAPSGLLPSGLPRTTVWTGYPVGTSNYAEQAAVAEALIDQRGSQVRMIGSDTAMGRMTPLRTGQAQVARLSDEAFYAFEGKHEFIGSDWGPQDLRTIWTPPTTVTVAVNADSGITSLKDLKGKRIPWLSANPSTQEKIQGILAYAGLTTDDIVKTPTQYSAQPKMLASGGLDMAIFGAQSAAITETNMTRKVIWVDFDGDDAALKRLQEYAPSVQLTEFESQIGMEGKAKRGPTYSIQMTSYAQYSVEEVYETVKAFDELYGSYKDSTATTKDWGIDNIDWMPIVLPHHDGLVKYLKEKGIWTPAHEERNQLLVERGEKLREGWKEVLEETPPDQLSEVWEAWKKENAPHPPLEN